MNELKKLGVFFFVGLMSTLSFGYVEVEASNSVEQSMKEEFTKELLNERFNALREKFKALEKQDTVMLNGENRQLYREYANPSEALALLKQTVPDTLEWLQQQSSAPL